MEGVAYWRVTIGYRVGNDHTKWALIWNEHQYIAPVFLFISFLSSVNFIYRPTFQIHFPNISSIEFWRRLLTLTTPDISGSDASKGHTSSNPPQGQVVIYPSLKIQILKPLVIHTRFSLEALPFSNCHSYICCNDRVHIVIPNHLHYLLSINEKNTINNWH